MVLNRVSNTTAIKAIRGALFGSVARPLYSWPRAGPKTQIAMLSTSPTATATVRVLRDSAPTPTRNGTAANADTASTPFRLAQLAIDVSIRASQWGAELALEVSRPATPAPVFWPGRSW